ncbi:Ig-like domain-containing protein [Ferruginibacter sp. SUN002]|uniref:Ig-like domain-containing protein n=1 Tax=Ferruginibacter sp. SUN002 TaxID=2937789 RepID=UPI003D369449
MSFIKSIFHFSFFIFCLFAIIVLETGCAQTGAPTGGAKDTIPPVLVRAYPEQNSVNVSSNKIVLTFNEYVEVKDVLSNVLISPYPKLNPDIDSKLKTVTIKIKDTLQPNTTYAINFGNTIKDINEGNPLKDFTYVFSTGNTIDSLQLSGKVIVAETGKVDSTILVTLYKSLDDSAVQKTKPDYITRLNSEGEFVFKNLAAGVYKVYALKDGDGGKTYNSSIEQFAFLNESVNIPSEKNTPTLYAYAEESDQKTTKPATTTTDKKLKYTTALSANRQDLLTDLNLEFSKPLKTIDFQKIILTDTNYKQLNYKILPDSIQKNLSIKTKWIPSADYRLIVAKDAVTDSAGNQLSKSDTLRFKTYDEIDYGTLTLRFTNIVKNDHAVLQFCVGNEVRKSIAIENTQWSDKFFPPGEYELRILYDANNDGKWTPGNYSKKLQPEKVITLDKKLSIRANWDNERDIQL